jgi:hypothetical protein
MGDEAKENPKVKPNNRYEKKSVGGLFSVRSQSRRLEMYNVRKGRPIRSYAWWAFYSRRQYGLRGKKYQRSMCLL